MIIQFDIHWSWFQEKHKEKINLLLVKLIEYKYKEWTERDQTPVQCFFLNRWYSTIIAWAVKDECPKPNKNNNALIKCNSHRFTEFKILTCETFLHHKRSTWCEQHHPGANGNGRKHVLGKVHVRIALQMKRTAVSEESTQGTNSYQCLFEMSPGWVFHE